jgi:hypothetical protein
MDGKSDAKVGDGINGFRMLESVLKTGRRLMYDEIGAIEVERKFIDIDAFVRGHTDGYARAQRGEVVLLVLPSSAQDYINALFARIDFMDDHTIRFATVASFRNLNKYDFGETTGPYLDYRYYVSVIPGEDQWIWASGASVQSFDHLSPINSIYSMQLYSGFQWAVLFDQHQW